LLAAALALVTAGAAMTLYGVTRPGLRDRRGRTVTGIGAVAVLLGAATTVRTLSPSDLNGANPVAATPASLLRGEKIYREYCQVCHGSDGRGDGPAAAALPRPPADLRIHMSAGHTDGQLFSWVTNGMPGLPMPGFRDRLSTEERWHVINFIKTFGLPLPR
jgi:mono/diheme cytochrome c family protein